MPPPSHNLYLPRGLCGCRSLAYLSLGVSRCFITVCEYFDSCYDFLNDSIMPSRRYFLPAILSAVLIAVIGLVVISPFALGALAHSRHDWNVLSNIGQTYGAVSALLSSLALGGVVVSLLYQARDSQNSREQTTRSFQRELIKIEMDDPSLMTAGGAPWGLNIPYESSAIREHLYVQMWVFLAGNYALGELSDGSARYLASHELFSSEAGRRYWAEVGKLQLAHSTGRRKRFFRILDIEYEGLISSGVPVRRPDKDDRDFSKHPDVVANLYPTSSGTKHDNCSGYYGRASWAILATKKGQVIVYGL